MSAAVSLPLPADCQKRFSVLPAETFIKLVTVSVAPSHKIRLTSPEILSPEIVTFSFTTCQPCDMSHVSAVISVQFARASFPSASIYFTGALGSASTVTPLPRAATPVSVTSEPLSIYRQFSSKSVPTVVL